MKPTVIVLLVLEAGLLPALARAQDSLQFTSLVAGWAHTCGLTRDGRAYCWGWNPGGALGIGDTVVSTTPVADAKGSRSEEHTSELQSQSNLVCRLLLEKKKKKKSSPTI